MEPATNIPSHIKVKRMKMTMRLADLKKGIHLQIHYQCLNEAVISFVTAGTTAKTIQVKEKDFKFYRFPLKAGQSRFHCPGYYSRRVQRRKQYVDFVKYIRTSILPDSTLLVQYSMRNMFKKYY